MEQYSKILLYTILGIAILGGAIVVIRYNFKKTPIRDTGEDSCKSGGTLQQENAPQIDSGQRVTTVVGEGSKQNEDLPIDTISDNEIIGEMMKMLKYFNGDMGALLSIVNDPVIEEASVVFRNIDLTIDTHGSEMLKSWFLLFANDRKEWKTVLYKDKAAKLLSLLKQCGIQQSSELKLTWNENAAKHYRRLIKVEIGDECEVLSPYWTYGNKVFEQGLVRPVINIK